MKIQERTGRDVGSPRQAGGSVGYRPVRIWPGGFTLVEVLVVLVVIGILASLLLPVLAKAKSAATGIACGSNTRQIAFGWLLYADDREGRLVPNHPGRNGGWVSGNLDFYGDNSDNTNRTLLTDPRFAKLGPFIQDPRVFKCPADRSEVPTRDGRYSRTRSVAMNAAVGTPVGDSEWGTLNGAFRTFREMSQIIGPSPAGLWVLMDEHPDSIDDARFLVDLSRRGPSGYFHSWPANFHGEGANVAFADGHIERHRWLDGRTRHENKYCGCLSSYAHAGNFTVMPGNVDLGWIQARTSSLSR
ncbi:MAG: prepilin-type N-terminal cleavage/methylation domain-containing protein [Limisphaerales bacterium]